MLDYLSTTLTTIEGQYPGCGIFLAGDFNRLNVSRLSTQFRIKQLIRSPTRGDRILDLVLTNLSQIYDMNSVQILPPFGLSDHNVVLLHPKVRSPQEGPSRKVITKRDTRTSRKLELGRYLNAINWSTIDSLVNCEDKLELMTNLINNGLNHIMPIQQEKVHVNDRPWITPKFKKLIRQRQNAFSSGDTERFRRFRNLVNRERKILRKTFFTSKVSQLKQAKPSQWWGAVKRISGMSPLSVSQDLISQLNIHDFADLSPRVIANKINEVFLEPMQSFGSLEPPITDAVPSEFISESYVLNELRRLSSNKATGSDGISNWLLKEYADILSHPITSFLNSSFVEHRFPAPWKNADVIPVQKTKPINDIKNQLRPISLTPTISKIAEEFVIEFYIGPAILKTIDPDQFGTIPKSSTEQALISILHYLSKETDGTSAAVRLVLFDYRKAFDLIDHHLLVEKLNSLNILLWIINWVTDFLTSRYQRVKLSTVCHSDWGPVLSGVHQGTKLGPWLF